MAISVLPDGSKLAGGGGRGPDAEDASGKELALVVTDDDLQCSSLFNSSSSMGLISGMRNEGSHFDDSYEARDLRRLHRPAPVPTNIQGNNSVANRKKGLLSSFYTIAEKLFVFCGSLVILSLSYPLATNAKETFEDHVMQDIIIGSVISFFIIYLLTALASYLKDSESIGGIGFHIFKWLVLPVFLSLSAGLCVILRFCAHTRKSVLWSLGTVGYIIILSIWVWVFYVEVPQIREEIKKGLILCLSRALWDCNYLGHQFRQETHTLWECFICKGHLSCAVEMGQGLAVTQHVKETYGLRIKTIFDLGLT